MSFGIVLIAGVRHCLHKLLQTNWTLYIMLIMRNKSNQRTAAKEASHERIVDVAARAIRRSGYDGTGVADIMKEAGLTHGAFYAHFASREAMLAEAADRAGAQSNAATAAAVARVAPQQAMEALIRGYLSQAHQDAT
jgi:AcrR family transcriptional regulator